MLPFVFEEGFGFERYVQYALDVPNVFRGIATASTCDALGMSFRDFAAGQTTGAAWAKRRRCQRLGRPPDTQAFPEARIKKFMEMRGAD